MDITPLTSKINIIIGAVSAFLAYVFGEYWMFFVFYLGLNCGDVLSRWLAARITGTENSKAVGPGLQKKLGYWLMIALGFGMGAIFIQLGNIIGVNLEVTKYLGLFVLLTLITNEIRSILENLVEAGYKVPAILIKGLEVANKVIDEKIKISDEEIEEVLNLSDDEKSKDQNEED